MKKIVLLILLTLAAVCLSACNKGSFSEADSQLYENPAGYQIRLPKDWTMESETETETVFLSANKDVSLVAINELGGVEYYSLAEISDMLADKISSELFSSYGTDAYQQEDQWCRQVYSCHTQAGDGYSLDIYTFRQNPAIQYYLVFCAPMSVYQQQKSVIDTIVASLTQTVDEEELYQLTQQRKEAAEAAEQSATEENAVEDDNTEPELPAEEPQQNL